MPLIIGLYRLLVIKMNTLTSIKGVITLLELVQLVNHSLHEIASTDVQWSL